MIFFDKLKGELNLDNFIVHGTLNIVRRQKGIQHFQESRFSTSKIHSLYPRYHYVHFYTFIKNLIKKINNNMVKENWGLEHLLIDECNTVMPPDLDVKKKKNINNKNQQQPTTTNTKKSIPTTKTTIASTTASSTPTTSSTTTTQTGTQQIPTNNITTNNQNK
ncbi:hypothetical protein ACTFIU_006201 [Dictyostelium citrinum]